MIVVADSSPLRYLIVLRQQELLPILFREIWIPSRILSELSDAATPVVVRDLIENRPKWLQVRDPAPETLAYIDDALDDGERAALALARELDADLVLMDDAAGRRAAGLLRLRITGTIGVLRLAAERGLIDVPVVVAELRKTGFYLDEAL